MAIFNFPIKIERHAEAGRDGGIFYIQRRCKTTLAAIARPLDEAAADTLGIGVGLHTGEVEIGEFTTGRSDFTAIGGVVNLAARLEAQAAAGEISVSEETVAQGRRLRGPRADAHAHAQGYYIPSAGSCSDC